MCKNGSTAQVQLTIGNKMQTFGVQELEQNEDGYYCISAEVSAAQMNDSIAVTVVNGADIGSTATYSLKAYCDAILAEDAHSQYHTLIKEMLNYGAMAQIYFRHDTNHLVNAGINDVANADDDLQDLLKALYNYHLAAKAL